MYIQHEQIYLALLYQNFKLAWDGEGNDGYLSHQFSSLLFSLVCFFLSMWMFCNLSKGFSFLFLK